MDKKVFFSVFVGKKLLFSIEMQRRFLWKGGGKSFSLFK